MLMTRLLKISLLCLLSSISLVYGMVASNNSQQNGQVTGQVISSLAEIALKLRLTKQR